MLIAASEVSNEARRWIIGALTHQGFENKDTFYGNYGSLYALSPVFNAFPSSGRIIRTFLYFSMDITYFFSEKKNEIIALSSLKH